MSARQPSRTLPAWPPKLGARFTVTMKPRGLDPEPREVVVVASYEADLYGRSAWAEAETVDIADRTRTRWGWTGRDAFPNWVRRVDAREVAP